VDWHGKRVLVTGAAGFIGSHLTERLVQEGAAVRAFIHYNSFGSWGWLDGSPVSDELDVVVGDICDRDTVRRAACEVSTIFHLAALVGIPYSYHAPLSYVRTNVEGTLNVLQSAGELGTDLVVHTSTSEVYGTAQRVPIDESHPLQGQSPYSASKIGADKLAESFHLSYGLPVVTVRPFNTYGPRQSARAVIPAIIVQCLAGQAVKLGNLDPVRDFTYVSDTVEGFLRAASTAQAVGMTVNLGSGREISIGDLAAMILRLTGSSACIEPDEQRTRPGPSEVDRLAADNTLARKLLQWQPNVGLENGLQQTIEWIETHLERYRPHVYNV